MLCFSNSTIMMCSISYLNNVENVCRVYVVAKNKFAVHVVQCLQVMKEIRLRLVKSHIIII